MKIEKFVRIEDTVEIELTAEDISLILEESETLSGLLFNFNHILQFLKAVPDKLIKELSDEHRKIITKAFEEIVMRINEV